VADAIGILRRFYSIVYVQNGFFFGKGSVVDLSVLYSRDAWNHILHEVISLWCIQSSRSSLWSCGLKRIASFQASIKAIVIRNQVEHLFQDIDDLFPLGRAVVLPAIETKAWWSW
jgi:hypothetical protein